MKIQAVISLFIGVLLLSCSSSNKINESDIRQGKCLNYATKSHTGQYFAIFARPQKEKPKQKVLYQDTTNIYFAYIDYGLFSNKGKVKTYCLYKIPLTEMERDIPLYQSGELDKLIGNSLVKYTEETRLARLVEIEKASIITRGDSINYQIQTTCSWWHFERGRVDFSALFLMDKQLNVIEVFRL